MPRSPRTCLLLAAASGLALGCSEPGTDASYDPTIPTDWVSEIDNPYFPLIPGTIYVYTSQTADGQETDTVEVLAGSVAVNGVAATDVLDLVYVDGALTEETHDWYAQDGAGNVWYLGEDTKEYENGQVVSTAGSWTWGVDGALPGVLMWADPAALPRHGVPPGVPQGRGGGLGKSHRSRRGCQCPGGRLHRVRHDRGVGREQAVGPAGAQDILSRCRHGPIGRGGCGRHAGGVDQRYDAVSQGARV